MIDDPLRCDFDPDTRSREADVRRGQGRRRRASRRRSCRPSKISIAVRYDSHGRSSSRAARRALSSIGSSTSRTRATRTSPRCCAAPRTAIPSSCCTSRIPGVPVAVLNDLSRKPDLTRNPPEHAWWEFDIDDVTTGKADFMNAITNADDPNLHALPRRPRREADSLARLGRRRRAARAYARLLQRRGRDDVRRRSAKARERTRLFMFPGMGHCSGGAGPDTWDPLAPLVAWVEKGDSARARRRDARDCVGPVDNERRVCAHPKRAVYTGPAGGANDRANWRAENFTCEAPAAPRR